MKQDFYAAMPWTATNGVYINMPANTPYPGINASKVNGYHAVVVVGWGIEKGVKNWMGSGPATLDIPYWIVRNSWSIHWNAGNHVNNNRFHMPGYWKHAMHVKVNGVYLNHNIGIDHMAQTPGGLIGGCTSFLPKTARIMPSRVEHNDKDKNESKKRISMDTTTKVYKIKKCGQKTTTVITVSFILLVLLTVVLAMACSDRR